MWLSSFKYLPVRNNIESGNVEEIKVDEQYTSATARPLPQRKLIPMFPWLIHFILLLISSSLFFKSRQLQIGCQYSADIPIAQEFTDAVAAVGNRKPLTFDGEFFSPSKFRGYPNSEIDAAWDNITLVGSLAISRADMIRINKLVPSSADLPEEVNESYQGSIEVFHQLHCLNLLRQMTYSDYYREEEWFSNPMLRTHTDHCIEILRQKLMCESDLHVFTYNWVDRATHPWPDFSTTQMCRNFEDVLRWGLEHQAYTSAPNGRREKPKDGPVLHVPSNEELGLDLG